MKRKVLATSVAAIMLVMGVFAVTSLTPPGVVVAQAAQVQAEQPTAEEMRAEIDELRQLILLLLQNMTNGNGYAQANPQGAVQTQAGIPNISSQRARDIAVETVGHGVAREVMLFTENGVLLFEVDVRNGATRYMVYINAATGAVVRMNSFNDGAVITPVPPIGTLPTPSPSPNPSPSPSPTQTPNSSSQQTPNSSSQQTPNSSSSQTPSSSSSSPRSTSSPSGRN